MHAESYIINYAKKFVEFRKIIYFNNKFWYNLYIINYDFVKITICGGVFMPRKKKIAVNDEEQEKLDHDNEKDLIQANAIIARTLIRRGGSVEEVAESTGLSIEHVSHIKDSNTTRKSGS